MKEKELTPIAHTVKVRMIVLRSTENSPSNETPPDVPTGTSFPRSVISLGGEGESIPISVESVSAKAAETAPINPEKTILTERNVDPRANKADTKPFASTLTQDREPPFS